MNVNMSNIVKHLECERIGVDSFQQIENGFRRSDKDQLEDIPNIRSPFGGFRICKIFLIFFGIFVIKEIVQKCQKSVNVCHRVMQAKHEGRFSVVVTPGVIGEGDAFPEREAFRIRCFRQGVQELLDFGRVGFFI